MYQLHLEKHDVRVAVSTIIKVLGEVGYRGFREWLISELEREQGQFNAAITFVERIIDA